MSRGPIFQLAIAPVAPHCAWQPQGATARKILSSLTLVHSSTSRFPPFLPCSSFFHLTLENCEGELALVQAAMDAANKEVDAAAEDRKGGAGHLGKVFLSAGDKHVAIVAHVPQPLQETVALREWFDRVTLAMTSAEDIEIVSQTPEQIAAIAKGNPAKEKFPLKMRDAGINAGFAFLHEKSALGRRPGVEEERQFVLTFSAVPNLFIRADLGRR